nr:vegetative cell wall protein gp1-like [Aegilops tauschii subsp. strangulata]
MSSCDAPGDPAPAAARPPSPSPAAAPAPPAAPASPSAAVPSTPPPSSPSPALRWADMAELDDVAAGRPVVRRDPPPRPVGPRLIPSPPPRSGRFDAPARPRRSAVPSPMTPGKAAALGPRTARHRRASAWGVAGRSDLGLAGTSWRLVEAASLAVVPRTSPRQAAFPPACSPILGPLPDPRLGRPSRVARPFGSPLVCLALHPRTPLPRLEP